MSMFRKTLLTTAIIGAGLASTTGAAFAGDCPTDSGHGHGHKSHSKSDDSSLNNSCVNSAKGDIDNGGATNLLGALNGDQNAAGLNLCNIANNNEILSNNNVSLLGNIHNGDEETLTSAATEGNKSPASISPVSSVPLS